MKPYPTIPYEVLKGLPVYIYDKLDGSNIRAEWSKKRGFYKFGSRRRLLSDDSFIIKEAEGLILAQREALERYVVDQFRCDRCICFFEFWGPSSFAGLHKEDETHETALLDIEIYKRGFIDQKAYRKLQEKLDVPTPRFLTHEKMTAEIEEQARAGELGSFEGIVCKSIMTDKYKKPLRFKVKSRQWIEKVKAIHAGNQKVLRELLEGL